jgi:hypothetical protein
VENIPFSLSAMNMKTATRKAIHRYPLVCRGKRSRKLVRIILADSSQCILNNPKPNKPEKYEDIKRK